MTQYYPMAVGVQVSPFADSRDKQMYIIHDSEFENYILAPPIGVMVLQALNGERTIQDVQAYLISELNMSVSMKQLYDFLNMCGRNNLLAEETWEVTNATRGERAWKSLGFHRLLIRTEGLTIALHKYRWVWYNYLTIGVALALLLSGLFYILFPGSVGKMTFDPATMVEAPIFLLPIITLVQMAFHELGHTFACAYYGIPSKGWGFGLLWGVMPIFYTDTSRTYLLNSRFKRIMISLAGPLVDLASIGLLYLIAIRLPPGDGYRIVLEFSLPLMLSLMLLNLNPLLMRLDGYWIAVDFLGKPNLRQSAMQYIKVQAMNLIGKANEDELRIVQKQLAQNKRLHWLYMIYFTLTVIWTGFMVLRLVMAIFAMAQG